MVLNDHHEGYIGWSEYERNQELLAANAYGKAGGVRAAAGAPCSRDFSPVAAAGEGWSSSMPDVVRDIPSIAATVATR